MKSTCKNNRTKKKSEKIDPQHKMCKLLIYRCTSIGGSGGGGGAPPSRPPKWDPILSFLQMFLPKSTHVRGWCPPTARRPPQREILDLPLTRMDISSRDKISYGRLYIGSKLIHNLLFSCMNWCKIDIFTTNIIVSIVKCLKLLK